MYISFAESCAKGFKRWSDAHPAAGNDNDSGNVPNGVALAITEAETTYTPMTSVESPRHPWRVPGMANTL